MILNINDIEIKSDVLVTRDTSLIYVLKKVLSLIDPANVDIITYSINDDSIRILHSLKNSGTIQSLNLVLNNDVKKHKFPLCLFLRKFATSVRFSDSHIKLVLIHNETIKIVIITSANLTENRRWELYSIITSPDVLENYSKIFNHVSSNSQALI